MSITTQRLAGCTAQSLDSYLRGLGFFLLAAAVEPSARAWWDDSGVMWIASPIELSDLSANVVEGTREEPPSLRTPWRGKEGRDRDFVELRNEAADVELDWFDACSLARPPEESHAGVRRQPRGQRENNPLLGEGASFGRGEIAAAYQESISRIRNNRTDPAALADSLVATVSGRRTSAKEIGALAIKNAVLGAYQSGRATGPGSSIKDVKASNQPLRSNAWDVVLILTGLRLFRGTLTRRPLPGAQVQASFPFVVRSRPIGTAPEAVPDLRIDSQRTFEFLAPLWTAPCTSRVLRHLASVPRLRLRHGVARDTLDAVLVQAGRGAQSLGFDRLVRFAFVPVDPKKPARYAVRRGEVHARGTEAARRALDEIVPFLRHLDKKLTEEPPALLAATRRLEDALAAFGSRRQGSEPAPSPEHQQVQEALVSLAQAQTPAARAVPELTAPFLSASWFRLADDGTAEYRLARSLLAGLTTLTGSSLLRETILPNTRTERGGFVLDPSRSLPFLERVADPVATLVELHLSALRRSRGEDLVRAGSARFEDVAFLLAGDLGHEGERKILLLCGALAGVTSVQPPSVPPSDPVACGIGNRIATLLLAAQPADYETSDRAGLERMERLASLLLANRVETAYVAADRELRRRGLDLLPAPPISSSPARPALLALAVLSPFDQQARLALKRVVSRTPLVSPQEGVST